MESLFYNLWAFFSDLYITVFDACMLILRLIKYREKDLNSGLKLNYEKFEIRISNMKARSN